MKDKLERLRAQWRTRLHAAGDTMAILGRSPGALLDERDHATLMLCVLNRIEDGTFVPPEPPVLRMGRLTDEDIHQLGRYALAQQVGWYDDH